MKNYLHCSHFHYRSCFSLLQGCMTPEQICTHAAGQGASAAVLSDINNFYGMVRFINAAERQGIRPVSAVDLAAGGKVLCTVYPETRAAYASLNRILSEVLDAERDQKDIDPLSLLLEQGWEGAYIVSPHRDVLLRLRRAGSERLYAALEYDRPYRALARWAREEGFAAAAGSTVIFENSGDWKLFRLLEAIRKSCRVRDLPPAAASDYGTSFVGAAEMAAYFSAVPDAAANTAMIMDACDSRRFICTDGYVFPSFQGLDDDAAFGVLGRLCREGVARRYGGMTDVIRKRLDYELNIIRKKGFAGYFLVVHDIVSRSRRTCGRGSSAASIVSYLLGITHVDPLRYNLFFERFLNMGRKDPPDIDVDFPWDERSEAFSYIFSHYGDSAAMVADHITFGPRSSVREPARAFGIGEEETGRIMREWRIGKRDLPEYLKRAATRLRGMPRHIGTHPGGVVITPEAITNYTHIQTADCGLKVIAWEKDAAEDAGLVKIDILGNRSLGVLRDSISMVNGINGNNISWESFCPLNNKETREQIEQGDTLGIFYVESPATRQLLKKMGTGDYEHLVIASSIIRPAANSYINEFVRRLKGSSYTPLHPTVAETLKETYGIMVYQEDVSRIAIDLCGFTPGEADRMRKILSKKDRECRMGAVRDLFYTKGRGRNVSAAVLDELWNGILSFTGYSFCKAHSASYALVSYKLAWMKRFYPLQFMVSVINNGGGFYSRQVYINAVRRMGFPVLGPDVNKSEYLYSIENGSMRVGFCQLREVSRPVLEKILLERSEDGPFRNIHDFFRRVSLNHPDIRILIRSGSLDSIAGSYNRPQLFWLFFHRSDNCYLFDMTPVPPPLKAYPEPVRVLDEINCLGVVVSRHPVAIFRPRAVRYCAERNIRLDDSARLDSMEGKDVSILAMMVTEKQVLTKKKDVMSFISFEDEQTIVETVLFPKTYSAMLEQLGRGYVFIVQGRVEKEFGVTQINVSALLPLSRYVKD